MTHTRSFGVMGEIGSTMVGVFTPFLLERLPPGVGKEGHAEGEEITREEKQGKIQENLRKRGCKAQKDVKKKWRRTEDI